MDNKVFSKQIFDLFRKYKDRKFIFVEPSGNFGDNLIDRGAEKLGRMAGISFVTRSFEDYLRDSTIQDEVIYVHGGGALNPLYAKYLLPIQKKAIVDDKGPVILAPQSVFGGLDFLKEQFLFSPTEKNKSIYMFAREQASYDQLKQVVPDWLQLDIDHDTAFNLSKDDITQEMPQKSYVLYAIREDPEKVPFSSKDPLSVWLDPIFHCRTFYDWMKVHLNAQKIITNRLHSAVLGSILDIPTVLLANNYHKNRGVYDYSLKYLGVQWADDIPMSSASRVINRVPLVRNILQSYKFQGMLQVWHGVR